MKAVLVAKSPEKCGKYLDIAEKLLEKEGAEVIAAKNRGMEALQYKEVSGADFCIVMGGDGSILSACRALPKKPVLGINFGNLGYLSAGEPEETEELIKRALAGEYSIEERISLKAKRGDKIFHGVNEAVLHRQTPHLIDVTVFIDGQLADRVHADGIMAATPTGSTAYNLSAGGPIIIPTAESLVITPICAHTLGARPIVVGKENSVKFRSENEAELSFDGISAGNVLPGEEIEITAGEKIKLMRIGSDGFFRTLRKKLSGNIY